MLENNLCCSIFVDFDVVGPYFNCSSSIEAQPSLSGHSDDASCFKSKFYYLMELLAT